MSQMLAHKQTGVSAFLTQHFLQDPVSAQDVWKAQKLFPILKAAQGVLWHLLSATITGWSHAAHTKEYIEFANILSKAVSTT